MTVNSNNIYDSIYIKNAMFPCDLNFDRFLKNKCVPYNSSELKFDH